MVHKEGDVHVAPPAGAPSVSELIVTAETVESPTVNVAVAVIVLFKHVAVTVVEPTFSPTRTFDVADWTFATVVFEEENVHVLVTSVVVEMGAENVAVTIETMRLHTPLQSSGAIV